MYIIIIVILLLFLVLQSRGSVEHFISIFKKRSYYLESTSMHPINYSKCIGIPSSDNRISNAPFYVKSFENVRGYTLGNIAYYLQAEVNRLKKATIGSVLIITNPNKTLDVHLLFPEFDTEGDRVISYAAIAKNNRWYYMLLYNLFYNAGTGVCLVKTTSNQCPGIATRIKRKNYFFIEFIDHFITPCGIYGVANNSPLVPSIQQNNFYAHYIPNPKNFNLTPYPNLAYMSQYDTIKYGCESQLISENRRYILLLDRAIAKFGVYSIKSGNPYDFCFSGKLVAKQKIWEIPLSSRTYATFKIENNYIVLIDYDRPIFKIIIGAPNLPIVLKLSNNGDFEIYDTSNKKIRTISYYDILSAIAGKKISGIDVDLQALRDNLDEEARRKAEADARARETDELLLNEAALNEYNKKTCPIGT